MPTCADLALVCVIYLSQNAHAIDGTNNGVWQNNSDKPARQFHSKQAGIKDRCAIGLRRRSNDHVIINLELACSMREGCVQLAAHAALIKQQAHLKASAGSTGSIGGLLLRKNTSAVAEYDERTVSLACNRETPFV